MHLALYYSCIILVLFLYYVYYLDVRSNFTVKAFRARTLQVRILPLPPLGRVAELVDARK